MRSEVPLPCDLSNILAFLRHKVSGSPLAASLWVGSNLGSPPQKSRLKKSTLLSSPALL
eukprot:CAMPEP_0206481734 /NCGR_PEP_ID=MMETSP0324_2-20121206/38349_1 /ASSEMBLY_ACC=CAM_ASM_000836 /TAXON_ID=2866 /ORGANISM="Crypthecodinium cohnii, Strain Seligo" /LENGTH=58 /DNA_ID=CAMNT_0053959335 /DNA_START=501 /DNA_END=677 /DNA_ORIENTATION=-